MKSSLTAAAIATLSLNPNPPIRAAVQEAPDALHQIPPQRESRALREAKLRGVLRQSSLAVKTPRWVREARLRETCRTSGYPSNAPQRS